MKNIVSVSREVLRYKLLVQLCGKRNGHNAIDRRVSVCHVSSRLFSVDCLNNLLIYYIIQLNLIEVNINCVGLTAD